MEAGSADPDDRFHECKPINGLKPDRCLGGFDSACELGYTGPLCSLCWPKWYKSRQNCQPCDSGEDVDMFSQPPSAPGVNATEGEEGESGEFGGGLLGWKIEAYDADTHRVHYDIHVPIGFFAMSIIVAIVCCLWSIQKDPLAPKPKTERKQGRLERKLQAAAQKTIVGRRFSKAVVSMRESTRRRESVFDRVVQDAEAQHAEERARMAALSMQHMYRSSHSSRRLTVGLMAVQGAPEPARRASLAASCRDSSRKLSLVSSTSKKNLQQGAASGGGKAPASPEPKIHPSPPAAPPREPEGTEKPRSSAVGVRIDLGGTSLQHLALGIHAAPASSDAPPSPPGSPPGPPSPPPSPPSGGGDINLRASVRGLGVDAGASSPIDALGEIVQGTKEKVKILSASTADRTRDVH